MYINASGIYFLSAFTHIVKHVPVNTTKIKAQSLRTNMEEKTETNKQTKKNHHVYCLRIQPGV